MLSSKNLFVALRRAIRIAWISPKFLFVVWHIPAQTATSETAQETAADFGNNPQRPDKNLDADKQRLPPRPIFLKEIAKMTTTRFRNAASFGLRWLRNNPQHSVPFFCLRFIRAFG